MAKYARWRGPSIRPAAAAAAAALTCVRLISFLLLNKDEAINVYMLRSVDRSPGAGGGSLVGANACGEQFKDTTCGCQGPITLDWGSLTMTSMRVVMEGFSVNGVYTGRIADHRGCRAFPSVFAMLCIAAETVKQGWHVALTLRVSLLAAPGEITRQDPIEDSHLPPYHFLAMR